MIRRFQPSDGSEAVAAAVQQDGGAIIEGLVSEETMDRIQREIAPWLEQLPFGSGEAAGMRTRRLGGLVARSPTARKLITHPLVLEIGNRDPGSA